MLSVISGEMKHIIQCDAQKFGQLPGYGSEDDSRKKSRSEINYRHLSTSFSYMEGLDRTVENMTWLILFFFSPL